MKRNKKNIAPPGEEKEPFPSKCALCGQLLPTTKKRSRMFEEALKAVDHMEDLKVH